LFLASKGVLDTMPMPGEGQRPDLETTVYAITSATPQMITTPGELFPKSSTALKNTAAATASEADTRRPAEPGVRDRHDEEVQVRVWAVPR